MIHALLFENYLFFTSMVSYAVTQILKTILYSVMNKKFDFKRLVGSGGMPSSHSATVVALAVASLRKFGALSPYTAITLILAIIVVYDARGVRQEAGKHAQILNELLETRRNSEGDDELIMLNEMVGHTFLQVCVGGIIGLVIALIIPVF